MCDRKYHLQNVTFYMSSEGFSWALLLAVTSQIIFLLKLTHVTHHMASMNGCYRNPHVALIV